MVKVLHAAAILSYTAHPQSCIGTGMASAPPSSSGTKGLPYNPARAPATHDFTPISQTQTTSDYYKARGGANKPPKSQRGNGQRYGQASHLGEGLEQGILVREFNCFVFSQHLSRIRASSHHAPSLQQRA